MTVFGEGVAARPFRREGSPAAAHQLALTIEASTRPGPRPTVPAARRRSGTPSRSLTDVGREAARRVRAWPGGPVMTRMHEVERARRVYDEARERRSRAS